MSEIDIFFKMITVKTPTENKYRRWYNKILKIAKTDSIFKIEKNELIQLSNSVGTNSKIDVLSLITNIFSKLKPEDDLTLFKLNLTEWRTQRLQKQPEKNKKEISIISYEDLNNILKDGLRNMSPDNDKAKYIICLYLLFNFNVRNQDLIIFYTNKKELVKMSEKDKSTKNFIFFDNNKLYYLRNNYKTNDIHGSRSHTISNRFIKQYLKKNSGVKLNNPIFINKTKTNYYNENDIQRLTNNIINELLGVNDKPINQQIIYKIITDHYTNKNNHKKLKQIADNRGQNLTTQAKYYSTQ